MSNIAFHVATLASRYLGVRPTLPKTLRQRVTNLLAGDTAHGFAAPLTTPMQRAHLASSIREVTDGTPRAVARYAGLRPITAEMPAEAPAAVVGDVLLYRQDADSSGVILSMACARLLIQAGIAAVDADSWLLAAEVAGPGGVFGT